MSGLVGYIGTENAASIMIDALKKMDYRGYDSSGVAVLSGRGFEVRKEIGMVKRLEALLEKKPLKGTVGIGHTRWATHGKVSIENAHPLVTDKIALVHNGIIENYVQLREYLEKDGHKFISDTDSEVLANLISSKLAGNIEDAVLAALSEIEGAYTFAVLSFDDPEKIVSATNENPIAIGLGAAEFYIASDVTAIMSYTRDIIFLLKGELAVITREGVDIFNFKRERVQKQIKRIGWNPVMIEKGGYRHFFLKEICEQPRSIFDTVRGRISKEKGVSFNNFSITHDELKKIRRVLVTGCGTSWHAALIGKYLIDEIAGIPTEAEMSSELRDRERHHFKNVLMVCISQCGKTADPISCVKNGRAGGARTVGIINMYGSFLESLADSNIHVNAGPEISVGSTKSFTGSLSALYLLAIYLGCQKGALSTNDRDALLDDIQTLPAKLEKSIELEEAIERLSRIFFKKKGFLYLGRGINYPIAYEGAMKMKSLAYIYAEGYPGGEIKHGPIALIDKDTPVIVLSPKDRHYKKSMNDAEEIQARGGTVIIFASEGDTEVNKRFEHVIYLPVANYYLTPLIYVVPLQFLAYYVALRRGCNIDRPRNLAKSITVE